jgi:hypothetical protein
MTNQPEQSKADTDNNSSSACDNDNKASTKRPTTQEADENGWHAEEREHKGQERTYWKIQKIVSAVTLIFSLIAAGGAAAGAYIAFRAFKEAKRQADAAESQIMIASDTAKRQLRAYTLVAPTVVEDFVAGSAPKAGVKVTIFGQTPAYELELVTHIAALPFPLKEDIRKTPVPDFDVSTITRAILAPTQFASNAPRLTYAPNAEQFRILSAGETYRLFVWGEVNYRDTFKVQRVSRFCFSYPSQALGAKTSELCPTGNCADDQCN